MSVHSWSRISFDIHYSCDSSSRGIFAGPYHYEKLLLQSACTVRRNTRAVEDHQAIVHIAWRWRLQHLNGILAPEQAAIPVVHTKTSSSRTLSPIVKEILDHCAQLSNAEAQCDVLTHGCSTYTYHGQPYLQRVYVRAKDCVLIDYDPSLQVSSISRLDGSSGRTPVPIQHPNCNTLSRYPDTHRSITYWRATRVANSGWLELQQDISWCCASEFDILTYLLPARSLLRCVS